MARLIAAVLILVAWGDPLPAAEAAAPVRILALGDSLTDGWIVPGGYRWPLEERLSLAGYSHEWVGLHSDARGLRHDGRPGATIDDVRLWGPSIANQTRADVVLLLVGSNDAIARRQGASARLAQLLDDFRTYAPGTLVLVGTPPPLADPAWDAGLAPVRRNLRCQVVKRRGWVGYVDVGGALTARDLSDGVHPDVGGHAKIAKRWAEALLLRNTANTTARCGRLTAVNPAARLNPALRSQARTLRRGR